MSLPRMLPERHAHLRSLATLRPPDVSESALRVLIAVGTDLPPREWAAILGVRTSDVVIALAWIEAVYGSRIWEAA